MTRRTWGQAQYTPELMEQLEWWRSYYHFARYHESLELRLEKPVERKGRQQSQRIRRRIAAMAAGLTLRRWTVRELISIPLL